MTRRKSFWSDPVNWALLAIGFGIPLAIIGYAIAYVIVAVHFIVKLW